MTPQGAEPLYLKRVSAVAGLLISNDGTRLEWLITTHDGQFTAHYRVLRTDKSVEAESYSRKRSSRDGAIDWLRRCARARGFDARGIK
jgi:hypothetical protein